LCDDICTLCDDICTLCDDICTLCDDICTLCDDICTRTSNIDVIDPNDQVAVPCVRCVCGQGVTVLCCTELIILKWLQDFGFDSR